MFARDASEGDCAIALPFLFLKYTKDAKWRLAVYVHDKRTTWELRLHAVGKDALRRAGQVVASVHIGSNSLQTDEQGYRSRSTRRVLPKRTRQEINLGIITHGVGHATVKVSLLGPARCTNESGNNLASATIRRPTLC